MPVPIQCPNAACARTLSVPERSLGHAIRCPHCRTRIVLAAPVQATATPAPAPRAAETTSGQTGAPERQSGGPAGVPRQIGRFEVRQRLGAGAFGTVYRAWDPGLERDVALKVPQAGVLDSPQQVSRFLTEAKAAAALRHPNIVPVYEAGRDGDTYYIASAFIPGRTLAAVCDAGPLEPRQAAAVLQQLAEALAYAHGRGVVHRDVKPANVMLDAGGVPHLMDFGLAARRDAEERLTHDGAVLGTPAYMAPEQARGQQGEARPASDQYSLGVVLYELLTGRTPFEGPAPVVLFNAIHTEPPPPRRLRPAVPRDLETVCLKAMAKRPEERYADCRELASDLRRWLEGDPVRARRRSRVEQVWRWCRRRPARAGLAGAAVALVVLGVALAGALRAWRSARLAEEQGDRQRYFATVARAYEDVQNGNFNQAQKLLQPYADRPTRPAFCGWEWFFLFAQAHRKSLGPMEKDGHRPVYGVDAAWSPDGRRIAIDGWVHDAATLRQTAHFHGAGRPFAWDPTGRRIVAVTGHPGDQQRQVKIWDAETGTAGPTVGPAGRILSDASLGVCLQWSPDGAHILYLKAPDANDLPGILRLWDVASGQGVPVPATAVPPFALSPDGRRLVALTALKGGGRQLVIWDAATGDNVVRLGEPEKPPDRIDQFAWSPDGRRLAVARWLEHSQKTRNGKPIDARRVQLTLYDPTSGNEILTFPAEPFHKYPIDCLSWAPDGRRLAVATGYDVLLLDPQTGSTVTTLHMPKGTLALAWHPSGSRLLASDHDYIWLWDPDSGQYVLRLPQNDCRVLRWAPAGRRLLAISPNGISEGNHIELWDASPGYDLDQR